MTAKDSPVSLRHAWMALFLTFLVSATTLTYTVTLLLRERPSTDLFQPPARPECQNSKAFCSSYVWDEGNFDEAVKYLVLVSILVTSLSCPPLLVRAIGASLNCWTRSIGTKVWMFCFYLIYVMGKLLTIMSLGLFLAYDQTTPRHVTTTMDEVTGCLLLGVVGVETFLSGLLFRDFFGPRGNDDPLSYKLLVANKIDVSTKA